MQHLRQRRNQRKLIASVVTLAGVVVCAGIVQRYRLDHAALEQYRSRSDAAPEYRQQSSTSAPNEAISGSMRPEARNRAAEPASSHADADGPAEVRRTLERWRTTLIRGDTDAHVACYAPVVERYFRQRNVKRQQVARDKARLIQLWTDVRRYDISDVNVQQISPTRITATFRKDWDSRSALRHFSGSEKERLTFSKIDGSWLISGEEELKVYRMSRR